MEDKKNIVKKQSKELPKVIRESTLNSLVTRVGILENLEMRKIREKVVIHDVQIKALMEEHKDLKSYATEADYKASESRRYNLEVLKEQGRAIEEFKKETHEKHEELKQEFQKNHKDISTDLSTIKNSVSGLIDLQTNAKAGWGFLKWIGVVFVSILGTVSLIVGIILGLLNIKMKLIGA